ncbi:MAG: hypothetical protein NVV73_17630 [Cellvibrionaceae bacterium]|nr:hypothetical protein [Cellvibrionaceae bacterium]
MKKLVKLDPVTKRYAEVDQVKLVRVTKDLLSFLKKEIATSDPNGVWQWVVPLCEGVLSNTISAPIPYADVPLKYQLREGMLSEEFEDLYAPFVNCVTATKTVNTPEIEIDGDIYVYVDFESKI